MIEIVLYLIFFNDKLILECEFDFIFSELQKVSALVARVFNRAVCNSR